MKRTHLTAGISLFCLLILIFDAKTAAEAAGDGITICLQNVIPSLLPFLFLSGILTQSMLGMRIKLLRPIGRLCAIPEGAEVIWLLGNLGGYPIGAQCISSACIRGEINKEKALQMLGFCSNAGPAFLFGILGTVLQDRVAPWLLWCSLILSSLLTGMILSDHCRNDPIRLGYDGTKSSNLIAVIRSMSSICTWVILFRVILAFCEKWLLKALPKPIQITIAGILELTNGCVKLSTIRSDGTAFIIAACVLSFGGICVLMQTASITGALGTGLYFPGKVLQTAIILPLSLLLQHLYYPPELRFKGPYWCILPAFLIIILAISEKRKKVVAFTEQLVYNVEKLRE